MFVRPAHRGVRVLAERFGRDGARDVAMLLCPGGRPYIRHHQHLKAALAESVIECIGKPVLVDSSKSGVQLKYDLRNPRLDVKVIWLVRDGRGAALSVMRNARLGMHQAAYDWRRRNQEAAAIVHRLDRSRWTRVRYEALCAEPDRTLSRLWQFIGLTACAPESSSTAQYHVLGHRMRLSPITKIALDEKWRTELSAGDLQIFENVAGPFNRELGYG
jgi:hypothetical protein